MTLLRQLIVGLAIPLVASVANATVIDFNELSNNVSFGHNPLVSQGYNFRCSPPSDINCLGDHGRFSPYQADPGAAAIYVGYEGFATVMTKSAGGSFDFYSIDITDVLNAGNSVTLRFTFNYTGGGSSNSSVTIDNMVGLETFVFAQTALDSVSWITTAGNTLDSQFDNISTAPLIPEPQTYALMLLGLATISIFTRRHSRL